MVIQHAELRLGQEFTKEEFKEGSVSSHMIPDDFNLEITVSYLPLYSLTTLDQIIGNVSLVPKM